MSAPIRGSVSTASLWWRALTAVLFALLFPVAARAHLGSPNVFFEGPAGPFPVRVTIETPVVVPGLAQINVRVLSGRPESVTVLPVRWDAGTKGAPPADPARLVAGETNLYHAQLWLMNSGAYSVFVDVRGPEGHGTAIVPVNSLSLQRLGMPRWMTFVFAGLGTLLLALLISVVGSAIRESGLPVGTEPTPGRRRLAGAGMVLSAVAALSLLGIGYNWWNRVDNDFMHNRLYQASRLQLEPQTQTNGLRRLQMSFESAYGRADHTPLVADHGHLVHLFLVRKPAADVFAHLHPVREQSGKGSPHYTVTLPELPAGDYQLYADITHESGLTETLTNTLHLDAVATNSVRPTPDADDTLTLAPVKAFGPTTLAGDYRLTPVNTGPFRAKQDTTLRFDLTTSNGTPAPLEPYLGMYGHLIIEREDGSVFTHLHPLGSISMASQKRFAEREQAGYLANQPLDLLCSPAAAVLSFPYAFPQPGVYRVWLQTKLAGQVQTAAYSLKVD